MNDGQVVRFTHHGHIRHGVVESSHADGRMLTIVERCTGQRFARSYDEVEAAGEELAPGDRVVFFDGHQREHIGTVLPPFLSVRFEDEHPDDIWLIEDEELPNVRKATQEDEVRFADVVDHRVLDEEDDLRARVTELEEQIASLKYQLNNECERVNQLVRECADLKQRDYKHE